MDLSELYSSCVSGDRKAMGRLYRICYPKMKGIVGKYISDSERVKDVVHDGFIVIFTSLDRVRQPERLESWMGMVMKNLALQSQRKKSAFVVETLPENASDSIAETEEIHDDIQWEQLEDIIGRLPEGYRNVFRLSVLDGLSHKEIGMLLGIDPHSSSSQLSRAKVMLRRMITDYRAGLLVVAALVSSVAVWYLTRDEEDVAGGSRMADSDEAVSSASSGGEETAGRVVGEAKKIPGVPAVREETLASADSAVHQHKEETAEKGKGSGTVSVEEPLSPEKGDSIASEKEEKDCVPAMPLYEYEPLVAEVPAVLPKSAGRPSWSLSADYEGTYGGNDESRFIVKMKDMSDNAGESGEEIEVEVKESVRHHVPFVVGLSFAKRLNSRWSVETGLRYTYLRSDSVSDSERHHRESVQRVHYIGIPFKASYRFFTVGGFSAYGHFGGGLDIPVKGSKKVSQTVFWQYMPPETRSWKERLNAPLQWSAEVGVGLQYQFTPNVSIFAEPSFRYYFNPGGNVRTIRNDQSCVFTVPFGVRISW